MSFVHLFLALQLLVSHLCSYSSSLVLGRSTMSKKGILMILSPAKTLDLSPYAAASPCTSPDCDAKMTAELIHAMKKRKESELAKLLGISANLAKTAHQVCCCC
jgi:hypothetical protein